MAVSMERLSKLNAVSGFEDEAREYLIPIISKKADSVSVDSMGNIIAYKKGKSDKYTLLLGTNIDEGGFIVSDITETGFLKFKTVGDIDPRTLVSKRVAVGKNRVMGVIGMKAIHLQKKEEREAAVKAKDLYIDIGAKDKADAETMVSLGDTVAFCTEFGEFGGKIKGKALDRFGVIAVLSAMDTCPVYDTYYVFSAQREVPCSVMGRGMKVASFKINPDFALIIDTVNAEDFPKVTDASSVLGDGAVIEYMDRCTISDTLFINEIVTASEGIAMQKKMSTRGASIAGAVAVASGGAVVATVGIPCRYAHTPVAVMDRDDIDAVSGICKIFVKESDVIIDGFIEKTRRA